MQELPGIFFFYDLSPIKVRYLEERRSFLTFLTSVCAIVGGVFTVSGIVDATLFNAQRAIRKKGELGKLI
jgi:endoplasmic reticulum-Golgi intermediate compartment protein 3